MIDNNIIQSIGAGSGIDTSNIVEQLVEIERAGPQLRLDTKKELYESQISDYGSLKSAMSTLQTAIQALTDEEGLYSKTASFTESDALVPTTLDTDTQTGTYSFVVSDIAQSQSFSSTTFSDPTDAVGEGTLTFSFGSWDAGLTAFTQDTDQDQVTVTIDSSNNTLNGLRDAINDADMNVQASIVNNGSNYVLLITAESGASNELEITVSESGGSPTNTDSSDLSRFSFVAGGQQLTQDQEGKDASLTVNGLAVTRSSNTISDVVEGLTLDVLKSAPTETITVTVSDDKAFAEQTIRDFVDAYNAFLEEIEPLVGVDPESEEGERGSLYSDSLAKSVTSQFRSLISSTVTGLSDTNYTAITNLGIRTELDGTLTIDENDFSTALESNFEDIQRLMAPYTSSTGSGIEVNSYGDQTQAGSYAVSITTNPAKGYVDAATTSGTYLAPNTNGYTYTFKVNVNGTESGTITIPTDVDYGSSDELANAIQSAINADSTLQANNASVIVSYSTDHFVLTSNKYGSSSTVSFVDPSTDADTHLGFSTTTATTTSGVDVAGTVGGETGFGLGNVLRPKLDSNADGLNLIVSETATTSTVNFTRGFSGEFDVLIDQFLQTNGLFDQREDNLTIKLDDIDEDQTLLDSRMDAYHERLMQQFIAMENILNGLNSSGSFLENLVNTLPFTASNNR